MEILKGKKIEKSPLSGLTRIGDIIHFEGPLLSLYADESQSTLYLCDWVDRDEKYNRWLLYQVSAEPIFRFIHREISHSDLFNAIKGKLWTVDISKDLKQHNFREIPNKRHLSTAYFPQPDSFFEKADCPDFRKIDIYIRRSLFNELGRRMARGISDTLTKLERFQEQPESGDILVSSEIDDAGNITLSVKSGQHHFDQKFPIAAKVIEPAR